ncbi:MAG TPA: DMT family transporter [Gaiellaceae bacterium]
MSGGSALAVVMSLLAGLAGSVQIAIMGRLGDRIGVAAALAWALLLSLGLALVLLLVTQRSLHGLVAASRQPVWLWAGALMGTFIVLTITFAGPRIGTAATVAILIAGQLAMGALIDQFGLFGLDRIPIGPARAVGIALLAVGAALSLVRA